MKRHRVHNALAWAVVPPLIGIGVGTTMLASSSEATPGLTLGVVIGVVAIANAAIVYWTIEDALRRIRSDEQVLRRTPRWSPLAAVLLGFVERFTSEKRKRTELESKLAELEATTHLKNRSILRYETALNNLDFPLLITDPSSVVVYSNSAAREVLSEVTGHEVDQQVLNEIEALRQLVEESQTKIEAVQEVKRELEWPDSTGEQLIFQARSHAVRFGAASAGVVTQMHDIANHQQERTRHAEFVSSVCHELKTPMASIRAYVEMLIDGDVDPDETEEVYGFIEMQVDRLTRLVNNMLNLSRIESGVIEIEREDCELGDVLRKAAEVVVATADEKQITLDCAPSQVFTPVHVDRDMFSQAIINLLSNAVKYTPAGGSVSLKSRQAEHEAEIQVRDTGMGIPESSLEHIFERFYRVPENNQAAQGTGLGLSLVHYIVTEVHGGSLEVDSQVDHGTCFTIRIPMGHLAPPQLSTRQRASLDLPSAP